METYQYINLDYLNLMADNDPEMQEVMLDMLLDELPTELSKMRTCVDTHDYEELKGLSHKMKSTLSFVGNDTMTETNKQIEINAKNQQDLEGLNSLMTTLEEYLPKVVIELKAERG